MVFGRFRRTAHADQAARRHAGITVLEVFLVVTAIILVMALILSLINKKVNPKKTRDLRRVTDMQVLQKALSLYMDQTNQYPVFEGCISGTDDLTKALREKGVAEGASSDPLWKDAKPDGKIDNAMQGCYWFSGNEAHYSILFFTETTEYTSKTGKNSVGQ